MNTSGIDCDHGKIYWSAENDNYYCKYCNAGMGNGVYSFISQLKNKAATELEALQQKCDFMADQLQASAYVSKDNLTLRTTIAELEKIMKVKDEALKSVVDSCVHPDTAIRAVLVTLEPIRKALALQTEKPQSGPSSL